MLYELMFVLCFLCVCVLVLFMCSCFVCDLLCDIVWFGLFLRGLLCLFLHVCVFVLARSVCDFLCVVRCVRVVLFRVCLCALLDAFVCCVCELFVWCCIVCFVCVFCVFVCLCV